MPAARLALSAVILALAACGGRPGPFEREVPTPPRDGAHLVDGPRDAALRDGARADAAGRDGARADAAAPGDGAAPSDAAPAWQCVVEANGTLTCTLAYPDGPGPGSWLCADVASATECTASDGLNVNPGWTCTSVARYLRCTRTPQLPPEGSGSWYCWFDPAGARVCSNDPVYGEGEGCMPGLRRWCDGSVYDGWGMQSCGPDGTWGPCIESPEVRPRTLCACYFFFTDFTCCELASCIIPPGTDGWTCPPTSGQLCDYCSRAGQCQDGGACLFTNTGESSCASDCTNATCPAGYECRVIVDASGRQSHQCVPQDLSCWY